MKVFSKGDILHLERYLWVKKKPWSCEQKLWEKVGKYSPYFSKIPWVLCICIGNSLAMNAAHKESDIDLFIITKKKRIWTTRILITLLLNVLWERKTAKKHAWKFCLSFFITEEALDFSSIAIKNDIYLYYWLTTLKPIINRKHTFEKFMGINLSETPPIQLSPNRRKSELQDVVSFPPGEKEFKIEDWFFGNIFESCLKFFFLPRSKKSFQKLWKPFWVIISDNMLKFHDKDKRKEIREIIFS